MNLPQDLVYNIIDIIICRNDIDTLFNLYRINKATQKYINSKKDKYKINTGLYVYLRRHIENLKICSNCGIYMFKRYFTYQHNIHGVITLCTKGIYKKECNYNPKCDPVIITKKNKIMGGSISEMHPDVKTQIEKYKSTDLQILHLFNKYLLHVFFHDKSLFNKINTLLNNINYKNV